MVDSNPSSTRKDRILSADAKEILEAAKPSILSATPRRGGYTSNHDTSTPTEEFGKNIQAESTRNKGCPCGSIMEKESTFMGSVAYGIDQTSSCPAQASLPYKKSNFTTMDSFTAENASMLAIAISTVMLMASEYPRIPDEYLEYTKNYLECITHGSESQPLNIHGILQHISYLRENGLVRPMGEESNSELRGGEKITENEEKGKAERSPRYKKQESMKRNVIKKTK